MNELYEQNKAKGLMIVGVSDESEGELEGFIKQFDVKFPILLSKNGRLKYKVSGYPSSVMIDAELKVLKAGHPAGWKQADYDEALKTVKLWPADLPATPAFKALKASWDGRRYAELSMGIDKLLAQPPSDADKAGAEAVKKLLDERLAATGTEIDDLAKGPDFLASQQRLEEIVKSFDKLAPAEKAKGTLEAFKKAENVQKEIAALKKLAAFEKQLDAAKKSSDRKKLVPNLRALEKELKGTYAAEKAHKLVDEISSSK